MGCHLELQPSGSPPQGHASQVGSLCGFSGYCVETLQPDYILCDGHTVSKPELRAFTSPI